MTPRARFLVIPKTTTTTSTIARAPAITAISGVVKDCPSSPPGGVSVPSAVNMKINFYGIEKMG